MSRPGATASAPTERGQSHLIGVVLLFVVVLVGAGAVAVMGSSALSGHQEEASFEAATMEVERAGSSLDDVATGRSGTAPIPFEGLDRDRLTVDETEGSVSVAVTAPDGTTLSSETRTLGAVEYEQNGRRVAYQGGGVFEGDDDGSVVVSPPPVDYVDGTDGTLTLPIVTVTGGVGGGQVSASHGGESSLLSGVSVPLAEDHTLSVSIQSAYYQGWAEAFTDAFPASAVSVDHDARTVTLTLNEVTTTTTNGDPISSSLYSDGKDGALYNYGQVDSYDSDVGPYGGTNVGSNADVRMRQAHEISSYADVKGDVRIGYMSGAKLISGNVHVEGVTAIGDGPGSAISFEGGSGGSGQVFDGTFSTADDLEVGKHATFGDDVIVGGNLIGFRSETNGGSLYVHGDATVEDGATIDGDLIVGGDLDVAWGTVEVTGDVVYAGTRTGSGTLDAGGTVQQDASMASSRLSANPPLDPDVPTYDAMGDVITMRGQDIRQSNDNGPGAGVTADNRTRCAGTATSCTITAGTYYLETFNPGGETVNINTVGGDVRMYVEGGVTLRNDATVDVSGDNDVLLFVNTGGATDEALRMSGNPGVGSKISIPDDDASQFWLYARPNATVDLNSHSTFTGVIYGPGGDTGSGVDGMITNYAELKGAFVGNLTEVSSHGKAHLDEVGASPVAGIETSTVGPRVSFAQVRAHEVELSG